jgi:dihydrolipoyl dehydrogenase
MEHYQIAVLGGGPGGMNAVKEALRHGQSVVLVEDAQIGGTCLNRGCIPTKALLRGLGAELDTAAARDKADQIVTMLRTGAESMLRQSQATLVRARASVPEPGTVVCSDGTRFTADHIILATGSRPSIPPIEGAELAVAVDSDQFLAGFAALPAEVIIIGGGAIGLEFATACVRAGRKVTILEALPRILANMDRELSQGVGLNLRRRGVACHAGAAVRKIAEEGGKAVVTYTENGKEAVCRGDLVLIATGRRAVLPELGFALKTERGAAVTDAACRTSVPGLYAVGDCAAGIQLAHKAMAEGTECVRAICGLSPVTDLSLVPACVFTDPEVAVVGLDADAARKAGVRVVVKKAALNTNPRTLMSGSGRGFVKVVADADSGKVLGAQILCDRASDMIDEFTVAVANGLTLADMGKVIRPHPTYVEALNELFESYKTE